VAETPIIPSETDAGGVVDELLARQREMYCGGSVEVVADLMAMEVP